MGGKIDEDGQSHYISNGSAWYAPWQTFCNFLLFLRALDSQDAPICSGASVGGRGVVFVVASVLSVVSCLSRRSGLSCLSVSWLRLLGSVAAVGSRRQESARRCGFTRASVLPRAGLAEVSRAGGVQRTLCHSHPSAAGRSVSGCPLGLGARVFPGAQPSSRLLPSPTVPAVDSLRRFSR